MYRRIAFTLLMGISGALQADGVGWRTLAPGMDLGTIAVGKEGAIGERQISVLRISPKDWEMQLLGISDTGASQGATAREWAGAHRFVAVINAGMFATDHRTHVGYQGCGKAINSAHVTAYQSVAAFAAKPGHSVMPFRLFDLDADAVSMRGILDDYDCAVQNLRLIKAPGSNRWSQQPKQWSEAALGADRAGNILFIFARAPFSMHDFNRELLSADIDLVAAQHLEGGPEAQLYLHVGTFEQEWLGSYETGFSEHDQNDKAWPIPNVLGIRPRAPL
jgi:hypothetical protein